MTTRDGNAARGVLARDSTFGYIDAPLPDVDLGSPDVALGDVALLQRAVVARLTLLAGDTFFAACAERGEDPTARLRAGVLECVGALDQVHATLVSASASLPRLAAAASNGHAVADLPDVGRPIDAPGAASAAAP